MSCKTLLLLICLSALAFRVQAQSLTMEEALLRFFEQFRCRMIYEQDNIEIPRLEPYVEDELTFDFAHESLGNMAIQVKNLRVEGLSTFQVPDLKFEVFTLDFYMNITVPQLKVSGWYSLVGDIPDMIELTGSGDFEFVIEEVHFFMDGQQGHEGFTNTWWMNRMFVDFSLANMTGFMKGIMNDDLVEDFTNYLLNNAAAGLIAEVFPEIEPEISKYAMDMVPELLNGTPLIEVINIIFLEQEFLMALPEDECPIV